MVREIVKTTGSTYTVNLPVELIGKTVEVTISEIDHDDIALNLSLDKSFEERLENIRKRYDQLPEISHKNYKFDRDEANNWDE